MSRHRNVRALDFQEEYGDTYGGDVYGHSVEDDHFCVSPSTAAEFMYDRSQQAALSTFMSREPQIPEEDEGGSDSEDDTAMKLKDSGVFSKPQLNDVDQAKLYSCLEELRNIIGESTPDHVLTDAVLQAGFDHEKALNAILCQQDAPKPQREPRNRKNRDDYCSLSESSEHLSDSSDIGGTVASPPQTRTVVLGVSNIKSRGFDNVGKAQPPPGFAAKPKTHPPGFRPKNCPPGFEPKGNPDQLLKQSKDGCDNPNLSPAAFTNIDYCKENLHPNKDSRPKSGQQSFQDPGPSSSNEAAPSRLNSSTRQVRPNLSALAAQFSSSPPSQAAASTGKPSTQQLNKASEMSLSQLAASHVKRFPNRSASQDNTSAADPLGSSTLADESVNRSQSTETKQSLAHLAANNPPTTLTGPASNDPPKTVNLSALAANIPPKTVSLASLAANTPPKPSNFLEIQKPKAISLSALAAGTSPKTVSLSSLAANTPPKTTSLASLAANTPPKTTSLASLASNTAPKTMSLANLASNTPPKTVSLASLAANTPPKTVSLSSLAANITPKTTSLASLASGTPPKTVTLSGLMVSTKSKTVEASQPAKSKPKAVNLAELASSMSPKAETTSKPSSMTKKPAANLSTLASNVSIPGIKLKMASSSVPPGFTNKSVSQQDINSQKDAAAGSRKSAFCLSALAAQHQHVVVKPQPAKESKNAQSSEVIVPVTQASVFAKTLCSKYKVVQRESSCMPKKSRFSRKRQISSIEENIEVKHHKIKPFDFLTPSPDDIIKEKQKAAFGRPGSNRSAASNDSSKPAVSTDPAPVAAAAAATAFPPAESGVSQGVARMTFSANKQATTGFEKKPTKFVVGEAPPQATPEKASNSTAGATGGPDNAPLMETPKRTSSSASLSALGAPGGLHKSSSKAKLEKLDMKAEYEKRKAGSKDNVNLVVIGHVDAGKSTLMGHTLYQLGFVNKRSMHKYEQEAKKMGKASFAYAWVLDETEEERSRGVTMDVAQTRFETDTKMVTLLDAPGHKDFIPNMITGAAQADVAILVVNAARGEFETGFEAGGQTREHALLIRSLGVSQLLVAVNKMDMVDWAQPRFTEITKKLGAFLKQAGFRESDLVYVPCSGLSGENLTKPSEVPDLVKWYRGPCIVQQIDKMRPPERPIDKPLRLCVTDIFKGQGAGFSVAGTLQSGCLQAGERVLVMPQGEVATAKGIVIDDLPAQTAFAGDNTVITLVGIEMNNIGIGSILCALNEPIQASSRYKARVVIFNIDIPITKGFPVVIHYQSLTEQGHIRKLVSQLHKSTGEVLKNKPRCLGKNSSAIVELEVSRPICMELYRDNKDLGRFMLRSAGHTIAAGLVTEIINRK